MNSVASAMITGGTAIITTENGETKLSNRPPRRQAAKAPSETPIDSEKTIAVTTRNAVQPADRPRTSSTVCG
ncbi:hypothetical protein D3C86_1947590 [compost metagenome]